MSRIRTLEFLPQIFQTPTNSQFLGATLDQLVNPPVNRTIQGYVGSRLGYGVNAKDYYVPEPTKERTDYQLEPGVVFLKENETVARDFISYPGILNSLKTQNGIVDNNNTLFESQIYSYDSFCSLDPIINFNQYYWLPEGPPAVTVAASTVFSKENYQVTYTASAYNIKALTALAGQDNPTLTLLRGGTYNFIVDQDTQFWIQTEPGTSGYSATQPNQTTRLGTVNGVTNNGATQGTVTFTVPAKDAQNGDLYPGNNTVNVVSTRPFSQINNLTLSQIGSIDGVTSLEGSTVMFYNTGAPNEIGTGPTLVRDWFYTISYTGDPQDPTLVLTPTLLIPSGEKITATAGTAYLGINFVKAVDTGLINEIPLITASLDTLYYQDGTNSNCVGGIKLITNNLTNTIDVNADILGQTTYTAPNGVKFTNGLKVVFSGDVVPASYLQGEYYVEGVGTTALDGGGIQLVPASSLVTPEPFTTSTYYTYDSLPYDFTPYDIALNEPNTPDYITIARNSINRNAWARSNRWFHSEVIQATAEYNNDPTISTLYATPENKAKRPIIQFYPNLKLFNSGAAAKTNVDFIDFRTTDSLNLVENQQSYYPDVETYTAYTGIINDNTAILNMPDILAYQWYQIDSLGTTPESLWMSLGAVQSSDGDFDVGTEYVITSDPGTDGTNWNQIAGTSSVTYYTGDIITAVTPGDGSGTGTALDTLFQTGFGATAIIEAGSLGTGTVVSKSTTTISISVDDVTGILTTGQWINDMIVGQASRLPPETRILTIEENSGVYDIVVDYPNPQTITAGTDASFVASSEDNINFALFSGARIIFANDINESIRNKIYLVEFNYTGSEPYPVITLTETPDGLIQDQDMFPVLQGYHSKGLSYYYNGIDYVQAQQKDYVNQAPLFDVFDSNGVSYSDPVIYNSSTFAGTKLFAYQIGTGINDTILGFPISYSSFNNVNDIRFENTLYKDTFTYVSNGASIVSNIDQGYVYNYTSRTDYTRLIGWQTAIAPSQQYQVFQFNYTAPVPPAILIPGETISYTVTCDVPQLQTSTAQWPTLKVFNNNNLLTLDTDYTVVNTDTSTIITVLLTEDIDTPIEVLILSDSVSEQAYYTIPVNLSNNPLNSNPEYLDLGDLRGQYQTIYTNNPNMSGQMFGANNYRDLGNMVPYGNRIIQNSASLVMPGAFLRNPETNLFDALLFNSREYIKFKTMLVDTINRIAENQKYDPASLLDQAMDELTSVKNQTQPFFWSDMLPCKSAYITNVYTFCNGQDTAIFPLSKIYDFATANYNGVLVYIQRKISGVTTTKQLLTGQDYIVSTDSPSLTVTADLVANDKVIVKEYNATYGSYVPNTPTKLGLYPAYIPQAVYETSYSTPTWFIQGHDGSLTKMYGEYNEVLGMCQDFRDQILLEYETRVYNNLKLSNVLPIVPAEVVPGYFRDTPLPYTEFTEVYSTNFLSWIGQNRLNYKTQEYDVNNPLSYNYRGSRSRLDKTTTIMQGNWRGLYTYFFDTATPNTTPWQMIGYANKPAWWDSHYGPAPYTSNNLILWTDMQNGVDWNDGNPKTVELFKRPGLLDILPVDSAGDLLQPLDCVISNYNPYTWQRNWIVGDDAATEYSYRKSSTYPFDLMKLEALIKPAMFYNLAADLDNYKYNEEFNQFLYQDRTHLIPSELEIYGNGTAKTSYINWIVDYQKQLGVDATTKIKTLLNSLDVRLVYRMAGFSDKTWLKFFVEKGTLASPNPSLLIPDESYQILLYNNVPSDKIIFSGVIVQKTVDGYSVFGNNQSSAYFTTLKPVLNGKKTNITVQDARVSIANEYGPEIIYVPYGTVFYTEQEVAQFLMAYGRYLESQGMKFEYQSNSIVYNWVAMVQEYLYWTQSGWSVGSVLTLNPAAENITIDKESLIVQPLTYSGQNFILNNNLYPIQNKDLAIYRDGTIFDVKPLNEGDALTYGQFELSNLEHGVVFNNVTLFGDVIYNLQSGLKQNRIYVRGTKSAEWNGTMFASGFIYNQDNITEWKQGVKYTQGSIVKYKNKYWTALTIVQPNSKFVENEWKQTDYNEVQKGLLPNSSTRSVESALYYNSDKANLEQDADLLSFSLIGFRPRDYMASADLTDITQVNVYKNMIKDKGTLNAMKAFKGANLPQGGIDYDIYENWAIQQGSYGGVANNNFVEFKLKEGDLTGNPAIVGLTNGNAVEGAQQLVPIYSLFNYGQEVNSSDVFPVSNTQQNSLFQDAGYVNVNDVKMMAYYYSVLPSAVNKNGITVSLNQLYVNDYVWLASYKSNWQILTPVSIGQVLEVTANLNGTSTVTFKENHNLSKYDIFAVINFDTSVNGYFVVTEVRNQKQVLINFNLPPQSRSITGQGIALKFQSHRAAQPSDIQNLPLLNNEFVKNKAWVDLGSNGNWAVYRKSINYQYEQELNRENSSKFGSAVAYSPQSGYLVGDSVEGAVYRYQYNGLSDTYSLTQTIVPPTGTADSFGTTIAHEQNIYAISQPTSDSRVLIYAINDITENHSAILLEKINTPAPPPSQFGNAVALSGDLNWLYVSDYNEDTISARNNVQVYRRANEVAAFSSTATLLTGATYQITEVGDVNWTDLSDDVIAAKVGVYFTYNGAPVTGTGTALRCDYNFVTTISSGSTNIDKFGYSISTNYYGDQVIIGAPNEDYSVDINSWGRTYVYNRLVQNINYDQGINPSYTLTWTPGLTPVTVLKNGIVDDSSNYTIIGNTLTYTGTFVAGDRLTVSGCEFVNSQVLETEQTPRIGVGFGTSVDNNTHATEVVIGAPFALSSNNEEGAAFRFTNAGAKFGTIIGTADTNVTTNRTILLNGYAVVIPAGSATVAAAAINSAAISNIQAQASNGKLVISVIDADIAIADQMLVLSVADANTLAELGIEVYTQTQVIQCPHLTGPTQFGTVVKFNEFDSVAISAPTGTRYEQTLFDFTDDENLDNDTVFDNNSTQFIDSFANAGAVYTFDLLANYNESLANLGAFTYAQSVNAQNLYFGAQPRYGSAIDWNSGRIIVGAPDYRPEDVDGQVVTYIDETGLPNWQIYRYPTQNVDIDKLQNMQIFSAETNETLINLDYIDPSQNKILGAVRQNIDVISNIDPANYNVNVISNGTVWGAAQVGSIWLNTSGFKYLNYHQNENSYNAKYWANLFPGSNVAAYSWIASPVLPSDYQGPGVPFDPLSYTTHSVLNASNVVTPVYYFWVRNTNIVFTQRGKTLADSNIETYITNPQQSGVSYVAPLASDALALYNCKPFIRANDSVLHVGILNGAADNPAHQEYTLIRQNYADDFLPGLPGTANYVVPEALYNRLLESLSGVDQQGSVVPDPFLPRSLQSGVLARPRQSFFYDRYAALKNYIQFANTVMALYPIAEIRPLALQGFLSKTGAYYDTPLYWQRVNWWLPGYDNNTKSTLQVPLYADLSTLNVLNGTIVTVTQGQSISGETEIYRYDGDGVWTRIGLTNGTIEFISAIYDYADADLGFGGSFYDTDAFDVYPSEETRWIVRALTEQIFTDELLIYRNKSLILLFEYIQIETIENQNYVPWLNKTSLIDVTHKIRELKPIQNYKSDNQEFLSGYVNETKPYHVVVKEFLFDYTGQETYTGNLTDFDLPAEYNSNIDKFVSPQLIYTEYGNAYQYPETSSIWQTENYKEWYNNFGLSIGQTVDSTVMGQNDYPISKLATYMTVGSTSFVVDNVQGFPINGVIKLYDLTDPTSYELIAYSKIDRENNVISGLTRGYNGTTPTEHLPGSVIFMDLPPVILFNGGKGYINPPRVQAVIPAGFPEPREAAQLQAIISLGTGAVTEIIVNNPGSGYAVTPEIEIDPAVTYSFDSTAVNMLTNTIAVYGPLLATGDLVRYVKDTNSTNIGGLKDGEWYYISVLDTTPTTLIALYNSYHDAVQDENRIEFLSQGTGTQSVQLGARAYAIPVATPVRENNITLRFDRTSFNTQVTDWTANSFYGSEFVGYYTEAASSSLQLYSTEPNIANVLASAEGTVFPVENITNERIITWSSGPDSGLRTVSSTSISNNQLKLSFTSSIDDQYPEGSTVGFTVGMPVKFTTTVGSITADTTYYVADVVDLEYFTISDTQYGSVKSISGTPVNMKCVTGSITDTAIITTVYPGIRQVTQANASNNELTVPVTYANTGGTTNLYIGAPVHFTGNVFGGIEENVVYFVASVVDATHFTISEEENGNVKTLTSDTGSMTMNISAPVSPGQVDGQQFTLYPNDWTSPGTPYYLKVLTATTFGVFSDPLCTIPVSGIDFPYEPGSWMLLPEPFYFSPSIVKYNNRVWKCIVSNNDSEFVLGNWQLLDSGDRMLNALDRAKGYYAPTVNMPGYDLTQLFEGLTYPNATYKGNAFELDQQFVLDTQLIDQAFTPTNVNLPAILFDGTNYIAPANTPEFSGLVADLEVTDNWLLSKMANQTLALTDIIHANDKYVMVSTNSPTPIFKSNNYQVWSAAGWFVPYGTTLANIEYDKKRLISSGLSLYAVAEHAGQYVAVGQNIVTTDDLTYWYERVVLANPTFKFFDVSYVETAGFTGYVAVGADGNFDGIIYTSTDGITWTDVTPGSSVNYHGVTAGFDKIYVVGDQSTLLSSSDGINWNTESIPGSYTLNQIVFADNTLVIVGEQGFVVVSTDGAVWTVKTTTTTEALNDAMYVAEHTEWTIVGDNNTVIQTNDITALTVIWDNTQLFSVPAPEYTVQGDPFLSGYGPEEMVPGIVYDNLTMIVKTRPGTNWPATTYAHVGYNVISVERDYTASNIYSFKNVAQTPSTISVFKLDSGLSVTMYETLDYTVNWIDKTVTLTTNITSGQQVRIDVYETGNGDQLVESSTDESPTNINDTTGFQEIQLNCDYTGLSYMGGGIVYPGSEPGVGGELFTEPGMFYNGTLLTSGHTNYVVATSSINNAVTAFTTTGLAADQKIKFSDTIFGGIVAHSTYYIKDVISTTEFTISLTQGGSEVSLTSATGTAIYVTQDYAVALADNQVSAKVILSDYYDIEVDYIAYTFYTQTDPQYGFTLPQVEIFNGDGTVGPYDLTSYLGGTNPENAVVEVNGLRISPADYTISFAFQKLEFTSLAPSITDTIAVTTYNDTQRQYFFTTTYSTQQVSPISYVDNNLTITQPTVMITTSIPHNLNTNDVVRIDGVEGSVELNGRLFIVQVNSSTQFSIQKYSHGVIYDSLYIAEREVEASSYISGGYVTKYQSYMLENTYATANDTTYLTVNNASELVPDTPVYFTEAGEYLGASINAGSLQPGINYKITNLGTTTDWNYVCGTTGVVYAVGDIITVKFPEPSTDGEAAVWYPNNDIGYPLMSIPELVAGQKYFLVEVDDLTNTISVSETQGGTAITLTTNSGYSVRVTQWEQTDVDRLWVTVNGERVASSNLRVYPANEVCVLAEIVPGDDVVITSMMPAATPNSETYIQIVDQNNQGAVYRANPETTTWTTVAVNDLETKLLVHDVESIVGTTVQTTTVGAPVQGYYSLGLNANKDEIIEVSVYNNTKSALINPIYYSVNVSGLGPMLDIAEGIYISTGDSLTITVTLGNLIYVNGEYMKIVGVDRDNREIEVQRGALASPVLPYIAAQSTVYSLFASNRMSNSNYNTTWNPIPGVYNTAEGDPLQIATSPGAEFLRRVVN